MNEDFPIPISVNWHLSPTCNYRCKYCFGHFRDIKNFLGLEKSKRLLEHLSQKGTQKISFSGGEPLLCPYLGELLAETKDLGMTTMIISNGSLITESWLQKYSFSIDWLGLSIDSPFEETQKRLGRGIGHHVQLIKNLAPLIKRYGILFKINTVVTAYNWREDLHQLMTSLAPNRWKVFKFLPIIGENERFGKDLMITDKQFNYFVNKHRDLSPITERNSDMYGSYVMIDPIGRLFQNTSKRLEYSEPILKVGIMEAINDLKWDWRRFIKRGGIYYW